MAILKWSGRGLVSVGEPEWYNGAATLSLSGEGGLVVSSLEDEATKQGNLLREKGDLDGAIDAYTEAVRLNPENAQPYSSRGQELRKKAEPGGPAGCRTAKGARCPFAIIWASPYTLFGLLLGGIGLCTGGSVRIRGGVVEFYGGGVKWLLKRYPISVEGAMACTLGHTIFGQTEAALDISRAHEMVHVRQFERWGPLMGPAYLGCSLVLWLMRRRPYRDNPFEREAFDQGGGA